MSSKGSVHSMNSLLASHQRAKKRRRRSKVAGGDDGEAKRTVADLIRANLKTVHAPCVLATEATTDSTAAGSSDKPAVLCLLLLIIDQLPYENVWRHWLRGVSDGSVVTKVFVHAKFPAKVQSAWVRDRLIPERYHPEWGSVELTQAMVALMKNAVAGTQEYASSDKDGVDRVKMLFASESCLPVCPLSTACGELFCDAKSWLQVKTKPRTGYEGSSQWVPIETSSLVPKECVCKADQWVCIARKHALAIDTLMDHVVKRGDSMLWPAFKKGCASDEMYFPTVLACSGILPTRDEASDASGSATVESQVALRRLTYVLWNYPDLDDYSRTNTMVDRPETYEVFDVPLVSKARREGCLFVRKVKLKTGCIDVHLWETVVTAAAKDA